jgi:hypothetical protein
MTREKALGKLPNTLKRTSSLKELNMLHPSEIPIEELQQDIVFYLREHKFLLSYFPNLDTESLKEMTKG